MTTPRVQFKEPSVDSDSHTPAHTPTKTHTYARAQTRVGTPTPTPTPTHADPHTDTPTHTDTNTHTHTLGADAPKSLRPEDVPEDIPKWVADEQVNFMYHYRNLFKGRHGVINYEVRGREGDPLVLTFHGFNGNLLTYYELNEVLSKYGFRVITFDLHGHGHSATPPYTPCNDAYSLPFFIQQVEDILNHLKLSDERLNVVGFSMGCVIAAAFVQRYIDRIDRVVFISPAGIMKNHCALNLLKVCACCTSCAPCYVECCKAQFKKDKFISRFSEEEIACGIAEAAWNRAVWHAYVKKNTQALLACATRVPLTSSENMFKHIGSFGIPTIIFWGLLDQVVPVTVSGDVLNCFQNAHLIRFEDASHLLFTEKGYEVIACILTFLDFPRDARMSEYNFLLPFNANGVFVKPENRVASNQTKAEYLEYLKYHPRLEITARHRGRPQTTRLNTESSPLGSPASSPRKGVKKMYTRRTKDGRLLSPNPKRFAHTSTLSTPDQNITGANAPATTSPFESKISPFSEDDQIEISELQFSSKIARNKTLGAAKATTIGMPSANNAPVRTHTPTTHGNSIWNADFNPTPPTFVSYEDDEKKGVIVSRLKDDFQVSVSLTGSPGRIEAPDTLNVNDEEMGEENNPLSKSV